jgi:hypothetical protein
VGDEVVLIVGEKVGATVAPFFAAFERSRSTCCMNCSLSVVEPHASPWEFQIINWKMNRKQIDPLI